MHYDLSIPSFHVVYDFVAELILFTFVLISQTVDFGQVFVAQVAPYQSELMELLRATGYLTDVCGNSRHCRITLSGWVSAYFEQYGKHVLICCHILGCIIKKYSSCTSHCGWSLHFRSFYVVIISNVHLD